MKVLKGYVRNMSHTEGSMAERYILDETMGFRVLGFTFDSNVASVFQQFQGSDDDVLGTIQYVGTLKVILLWTSFFTHHFISLSMGGENTLRVNHFCSKKVMYNKYYSMQ